MPETKKRVLVHIKRCLQVFFLPAAMYKLRRATRTCRRIDEFINVAFTFRCLSLRIVPIQIPDEVQGLLELLATVQCERVLEIGTASGGMLYLLSRVASPRGILLSIDLPGGVFGGGYPRWKIPLYRSFTSEHQRLYPLRGDSHHPAMARRVQDLLHGQPLDVLFIDGDHAYGVVKADFDLYAPLLRSGGLIVFHDIVPGSPDMVGGVPQFWAEVKRRWRHLEIVKSWDQGGYGIGVLWTREDGDGQP